MKLVSREVVKSLRQNSTWAERKLWPYLRAERLGGFKFRRQHPLGIYVLDFYCIAAKLVVECDGDPHGDPERQQRDRERDDFLEALGLKTLRFWNTEIRENLPGVLETILTELESRTTQDPSP